MKMLMPSHAPRVKLYKGDIPIFYAYDVEHQLLSMHDPVAGLKSGGYLVINPTEALVSVDVNSGKATKERSVEETALKTNIEAAEELARQLRLRDLAGLLVIDFIDMYEYRNRRKVERALKEALKSDRAKIQVGRISPFGLMEMSRQRLRPSVTEANTRTCPTCVGSGIVRSTASLALQLLRAVEKEAYDCNGDYMEVITQPETALYVLNNKREGLMALEEKYDMQVAILGDSSIKAQGFHIARQENNRNELVVVNERGEFVTKKPLSRFDEEEEVEAPEPGRPAKPRKRGGRKRGGRNRRRDDRQAENHQDQPKEAPQEKEKSTEQKADQSSDKPTRKPAVKAKKSDEQKEARKDGGDVTTPESKEAKDDRNRRPRGARRLWGNRGRKDDGGQNKPEGKDTQTSEDGTDSKVSSKKAESSAESKPAAKRTAPKKSAPAKKPVEEASSSAASVTPDGEDKPAPKRAAAAKKPAAKRAAPKKSAPANDGKEMAEASASAAPVYTEPKGPKKSGWWAK